MLIVIWYYEITVHLPEWASENAATNKDQLNKAVLISGFFIGKEWSHAIMTAFSLYIIKDRTLTIRRFAKMVTKKQATNFDNDAVITMMTERQKTLDDIDERVVTLEETLNSPDKLAVLMAESAKKSSVYRKTLAETLLSVIDDHDTRIELQKIVRKLDREKLVQILKYGVTFAIGGATILGVASPYISR